MVKSFDVLDLDLEGWEIAVKGALVVTLLCDHAAVKLLPTAVLMPVRSNTNSVRGCSLDCSLAS